MIKNYIVGQTNLSTASNNMTTAGVNGYIVCDDSRRIYYQSKTANSAPILVGTSNYWTVLSGTSSTRQTLEVGKRYVRTGSNANFNLPTSEYGLAVGDTIEFYNKVAAAYDITKGNVEFINNNTATSGQYFKFYWDGSTWQVLNISAGDVSLTKDVVTAALNYTPPTPSEVSGAASSVVQAMSGEVIDGLATTGWVDGQGYIKGIADNALLSDIKIDTVKVNGSALTPSSKAVDITVPTNYISAVTLNGNSVVSDNAAALTNVVTIASPTTNQFVYKTSDGYATSALSIPTDYTTSAQASAIVTGYINNVSGTIRSGLVDTGAISDMATKTWVGQQNYATSADVNSLISSAANRINTTTATTNYDVLYSAGDVHVLTLSANTTLLIPPSGANNVNGLPSGHGMIIKIINPSTYTVSFGENSIITEAGEYTFSVYNFGSAVQQIGAVIKIPGT